MKKIAKAKASTDFGKLSIKAGIDKNPKPTAADRIAGAKMKAAGKAKYGAKVAAKKPIKKAQNGMKETMLPEVTKKATSLRPMEIALGNDRKMSVDTVGYKTDYKVAPYNKTRPETFNYTVSDKSGKVIRKDRLKSEPGQTRMQIVNNLAEGLKSGKYKSPTFKSGGKMSAKKTVAKKGMTVKKSMGKCKMGC